MTASSHCHKGRQLYARYAWEQAYHALALADQLAPLECEDLERLAISAYLTGRDGEFLKAYERAHQGHAAAGRGVRAARCAFWLALSLFLRGEMGRASGWISRAQRLIAGIDCVERGYLLLPVVEQHLGSRDFEGAYRTASTAAQIGERFAEPDLVACARHLQGRSLLHGQQVSAGLALLDEAMIAVSAGELSPVMTGLLYCSVIQACQRAYALSRAREWTSALAHWCEKQPEMVAFTGTCLVHRAEVLQLRGAWQEALAEARRACQRFSQGTDPGSPGAAFYQEAEVHRLRGDFAAAESAYRIASQKGRDPQPGLALLRLAQGRTAAASAAIQRVMAAAPDETQRLALLPAYIEIMLAAGDLPEARRAGLELEKTARAMNSEVLTAIAAQATGAVALAEGNVRPALAALRHALDTWQQAQAPYLAARVHVLLARACRAVGDDEGAALELDAARTAFVNLGAAPDIAAVDALNRIPSRRRSGGLTARELQVLRLIAAGRTNKAIASELRLSEKTVDRHVSNIFTKLDVPSRAAATAYAYEHRLI